MTRKRLLVAIALVLVSTSAIADWLKDYEAGLEAAKKGQWQNVVQKMTSAINQKGNEGRERPYGARFIEYRPYYYRGIAYFELGDYEKALADLNKTKGPGDLALGGVDSFVSRAEGKLAQAPASTQTTAPTTTAIATGPRTTPPVETRPAVDAVLRRNAEEQLTAAHAASRAAQQVKADTYASADFRRATQSLQQAISRKGSAETNEDWRAVASAADSAIRQFEAATGIAQLAATSTQTASERAVEATVAPIKRRVRDALQAYFDGDFQTAAARLDTLTKEQKSNAMLWAFLGAAHYYAYYLDGGANERSRSSAIKAFRKARELNPDLRLNETYFSARVRTFFNNLPG